jgi:DNA-binding transcriptional ArsR family regulator
MNDTETRRAAYERMADGLIALMDVRAALVEGCEIDCGFERQSTIEAALIEHMEALMVHADFFDARTIAKFYVELRMHGDELKGARPLPVRT